MRIVKHRHRLSALNLEIFSVRLDRALSNLILLKMFLLTAGEVGQDDI